MQRHDRLTALPIALLVLLCALWGFQQVAIKVAIADGMPSVLMAALRALGAGILVALWMLWRQGIAGLAAMTAPALLLPGLLIGVIFGLEFLLLYPGLERTTASRGVLFLYTAPFFTALGAHWFLPGETLRARQALGLVIAFGGVVIAFADGLGHPGGSIVGDAMCALSGLLWGVNTILVKANRHLRTQSFAAVLLFQIAGSVPLLVLASWYVGDLATPLHPTSLAWISLAYQTIVVTFASYLVWFWLVMRYQAAAVSGFTFLAPLLGIAAGAIILGETATPALLLGLAAVAVGMRLLR